MNTKLFLMSLDVCSSLNKKLQAAMTRRENTANTILRHIFFLLPPRARSCSLLSLGSCGSCILRERSIFCNPSQINYLSLRTLRSLRDNCHPNLCVSLLLVDSIREDRSQYRQRDCSHHLGRLRETITSQRQLPFRVYAVYERSSSNAEYARAIPRVFSSRRTHARYAARTPVKS